ncbi:MAG: restriction endonuclease [Methanosarcinales archaeon]
MGNIFYSRGVKLEYKVKNLLEEKGYFVMRSVGSHGPVDLIAGNGREIIVIQCKTNLERINKEDIRSLNIAAVKLKAKPFIVGKEMEFINVKT